MMLGWTVLAVSLAVTLVQLFWKVPDGLPTILGLSAAALLWMLRRFAPNGTRTIR
ncbi:hypothetical protein ACQPZ2_24810 [Nocardia pseudovaccinii]|uniref:hypothetical protein n=1 Tax=Nocardia pseudovaccinii TaxID=189540 RepID=UPI003D94561C